jgi:hypothetical protein
MAKPQVSFAKRQREQAKRERQQMKAARRAERKNDNDNDKPLDETEVVREQPIETSTEEASS